MKKKKKKEESSHTKCQQLSSANIRGGSGDPEKEHQLARSWQVHTKTLPLPHRLGEFNCTHKGRTLAWSGWPYSKTQGDRDILKIKIK